MTVRHNLLIGNSKPASGLEEDQNRKNHSCETTYCRDQVAQYNKVQVSFVSNVELNHPMVNIRNRVERWGVHALNVIERLLSDADIPLELGDSVLFGRTVL